MAQPSQRLPLQESGAAGAAVSRANLAASVQYLVFEPGLYAVDLEGAAPAGTDIGLRLPAIRLDPAPRTPTRPGSARVVGPTAEGWIWRGEEAVFVLVAGGRAGMLLTIYRANDGMAAPEIRFRNILPLADRAALGESAAARREPAVPVPAGVQAGVAAPDGGSVGEGSVALLVLAHVSGVGDVRKPQGQWLGTPGSGNAIEGFSVTPAPPLDPRALEYQAILGHSWSTPWFAGGDFCGSRGLLLPLLGFRVRLAGEAAALHECVYQGRFAGGAASGPHGDGEACQAGDAPLEAMWVMLRRRLSTTPAVPPAPSPPPSPAGVDPPRRRARGTRG